MENGTAPLFYGSALRAQDQLAVGGIHRDGLAGQNASLQDLLGDHGLHRVLDVAAERSGAEGRVEGLVDDLGLGGLGQLAAELLIQQAGIELIDLQVNDLGNVLAGQDGRSFSAGSRPGSGRAR